MERWVWGSGLHANGFMAAKAYAFVVVVATIPPPLGGYGADATVGWVLVGSGEEMMNKAFINLYTMLDQYVLKR